MSLGGLAGQSPAASLLLEFSANVIKKKELQPNLCKVDLGCGRFWIFCCFSVIRYRLSHARDAYFESIKMQQEQTPEKRKQKSVFQRALFAPSF